MDEYANIKKFCDEMTIAEEGNIRENIKNMINSDKVQKVIGTIKNGAEWAMNKIKWVCNQISTQIVYYVQKAMHIAPAKEILNIVVPFLKNGIKMIEDFGSLRKIDINTFILKTGAMELASQTLIDTIGPKMQAMNDDPNAIITRATPEETKAFLSLCNNLAAKFVWLSTKCVNLVTYFDLTKGDDEASNFAVGYICFFNFSKNTANIVRSVYVKEDQDYFSRIPLNMQLDQEDIFA